MFFSKFILLQLTSSYFCSITGYDLLASFTALCLNLFPCFFRIEVRVNPYSLFISFIHNSYTYIPNSRYSSNKPLAERGGNSKSLSQRVKTSSSVCLSRFHQAIIRLAYLNNINITEVCTYVCMYV